MIVAITNIVLCLSVFVQYGQAISATDWQNVKAELKREIFEDERMKRLDTQLSDNILTTDELVTALQNQEALVKTTLNDYNELKAAQLDLKLKYKTLEMYSRLSLPETCSALRKTGLNESVTVMINPMGLDQTFAPIEVQCNLPEDKTYRQDRQ